MAEEATMKSFSISPDQAAEAPPCDTPSEGGYVKVDPPHDVLSSEPPQQIIRRDEYWDKAAKCWQLVVPKTQPDQRSKLQKHVLLVRRVFDAKIHSRTEVDISGAHLLLVLANIFRDVPNFPLTSKKRTLKPEYFFWARHDLGTVAKHCKEVDDAETLFQVEAALLFVAEYYSVLQADLCSVSISSSIGFNDLWAIFAPNTLVYGSDALEQSRVWRVKHASIQNTLGGKPEFNIQVEFRETDGKKVGWATTNLTIPAYEGSVLVDSLSYVPLHILPHRGQVWDALLQRAEKQLSFLSSNFTVQEHDGECLVYGNPEAPWQEAKPLRFHSRSRVIVDPIKYRAVEQAPLMPGILDLPGSEKTGTSRKTADGKEEASAADLLSGNGSIVDDDLQVDSPVSPEGLFPLDEPFAFMLPPPPIPLDDPFAFMLPPPPIPTISTNEVLTSKQGISEGELRDIRERLDDVDAILFSGLCYGFILLDGRWAAFSANRLANVSWRKEMLSSLVISAPVLDSMRRLVQSHHSRKQFDDFVPGKGKGLVGLFSGEPGLGKTFTAEAIAETAEKPLYSVSSGALGEDASSITNKLRAIMNLCAHWQAVLLVDEADVFLSQRHIADLRRNAVVSVFLRELEYYPGILILTTNMPETIDTAFQSRIHFCYRYPPLNHEARRQVWLQFIAKAEAALGIARVNIDGDGLDRLARMDMNGRQIKNAMSISITLAGGDDEGRLLTADSILDATRMLQAFDFGNLGSAAEEVL